MLFLLTDSPQKLKLEKLHRTTIILIYVSPSSPQLHFSIFNQMNKTIPTLHQVTGENTPHLVVNRILKYFLISQPLNKMLQLQQKIILALFFDFLGFFLLKTQKDNHSSASNW